MPISATIDERNGTTLQNQNAHYVVVASILSYTQLRTQRVELISKCPRFLKSIYCAKCEMLRGQNKTEVIKDAIVNFLHILGHENVFYHVFIEIELSPTIFKL